jgi:hypothetical protein
MVMMVRSRSERRRTRVADGGRPHFSLQLVRGSYNLQACRIPTIWNVIPHWPMATPLRRFPLGTDRDRVTRHATSQLLHTVGPSHPVRYRLLLDAEMSNEE